MASPITYMSALRRAIEQMNLKRAPVQQWLGSLTNMPGIRQSMLDDASMSTVLNPSRNSPVTRDELLQHLDDNGPVLDEIVYGGPRQQNVIETEEFAEDADGNPLDEYGNRIWSRDAAIRNILDQNEDELYELEASYRDSAFDDWLMQQDRFDVDEFRVQPYPPGIVSRNLEPRIIEEDPNATGNLFDPRGDEYGPPLPPLPIRRTYGETIAASNYHDPLSGYDTPGDVVVREGEPVRYWIAQNRGDLEDRGLSAHYTGNWNNWRAGRDELYDEPSLPDYMDYGVIDHRGPYRPGQPRPSLAIDDEFAAPEDAEYALSRFDAVQYERASEGFSDTPEEHAAYEDARQEIIQRYIDDYTLDEDADQAVETSVRVPYADSSYVTPGGSDQFVILVNTKRNPLSDEEYFEPHFNDTVNGERSGKNVFMHIRGNFRYDDQGRRVLFIDELQSKLHQKGYNEGYRAINPYADPHIPDGWRIVKGHELPPEQSHALRIKDNDWALLNSGGGVVQYSDRHNVIAETAQKYAKQFSKTSGAVPDFPLKGKDWLEMGIRRILHFAAENNVERIAWTTGEMQLRRYRGVPVDIYDKIMPNVIGKMVKKKGGRVGLEPMTSAQGQTVWVADVPQETRDDILKTGVTYSTAGLAALLAEMMRRRERRERAA